MLIATIDDGTRLTVVAQVAAGSQGVVVIPVVASGRTAVPINHAGMPPTAPIEFPISKPTPIYKKWWFWTLIVVGTLVIISAASADEDSASGAFMFDRPVPASPPGGATLFRF